MLMHYESCNIITDLVIHWILSNELELFYYESLESLMRRVIENREGSKTIIG